VTKKQTIAVDFDGTCVSHAYPVIGDDIGAVPVLQRLTAEGHKIILYTMRSKKTLEEAVEWFNDQDIPLYGVNLNKSQPNGTTSPKVFAHLYIDDAALGIPLLRPVMRDVGNARPFVNWEAVETLLERSGHLPPRRA